jgi:hypothetical protein
VTAWASLPLVLLRQSSKSTAGGDEIIARDPQALMQRQYKAS